MALITFMSDFGTVDHYVSAVKASIVSELSTQLIIDITHDIPLCEISYAANILRNVYLDFPKKTVHLISVDTMKKKSRAIALEMDGHFFVSFDTGIFSLISNQEPEQIVVLQNSESSFPTKDILAKASLKLASGKLLNELGETVTEIEKLNQRQLKLTKTEIVGHIISIDSYGNLITNISKKIFEKKKGAYLESVKYIIKFGRERFNSVHTYFSDVKSGDCYVLFNSSGFLQIGINKGNASELLGLSIDSLIAIEFLS